MKKGKEKLQKVAETIEKRLSELASMLESDFFTRLTFLLGLLLEAFGTWTMVPTASKAREIFSRFV